MADVIVPNEVPSIIVVAVANGQVAFDYDFRADLVTDLKAELRPVNGDPFVQFVGGTDFIASGLGTAAGGTIALTSFTGTKIGDSLAIYRDIPIERQNDYSRDLFAEDLNAEQDRVFMIMQELQRDIDRSVKSDIGTDPINITKGDPGDMVAFDDDGNLIPIDPPSGVGNMNTATYDPQGIGSDAFDRKNWGSFDSQSQFTAKDIASSVSLIEVGAGSSCHQKQKISTPAPVRPWHSQDAGGDWWEIFGPVIRPEMIAANGVDTVNQSTLDGAIKFAAEKKVPLEILGQWDIGGQVDTRSGLQMIFRQGSSLRPTKRSVTGSFITNVTVVEADRAQTDILIENPQVDGSQYPAPVILETAAGGDTTHIVFTAAASAVDDFYTGQMFQFLEGALATGLGGGTITDYVGATRTATVQRTDGSPLGSAPAAGVDVQIGFNDNAFGFAWGSKRGTIRGGYVRNFPHSVMTPPILGAKGTNLEAGNDQWVIDGVTYENCGTGLYLSGTSGVLSNGQARKVVGVRASNLHMEKCGSAITIANLDLAAGISAATNEVKAVIENSTYKNCGHAGLRIVGTGQEKCGIINLMGANGVQMHNIRGDNDADVVTQLGGYPTDYAARCGFGLSGPPGALIWGHMRNGFLQDIEHGGDLDAVVHVGRVRALGDDAPPGQVTQLIGWHMRNINVFGTVARVVSRDENLGFVSSEIQAYWEIIVDTVSDVFVPPQFTAAAGLILDIKRRSDATRIIGSAADLITRGNTFSDYIAGFETDLRKGDRRRITAIADDTFVKIVPLRNKGTIKIVSAPGVVGSASALNNGQATYSIQDASACVLNYGSALSVGTSVLANGAPPTGGGVDGNWNIHAVVNDGIYIKNCTGATRTIDVILE